MIEYEIKYHYAKFQGICTYPKWFIPMAVSLVWADHYKNIGGMGWTYNLSSTNNRWRSLQIQVVLGFFDWLMSKDNIAMLCWE